MARRPPDVHRRRVLRPGYVGGVSLLAGCGSFGGDDRVPVTVQAVDVLNRRETAGTATFVAERGDEVAVRRRVELAGSDNASRPTGAEISAFADDPGAYRFRLDVAGGGTLETTPSALGVTAAGADCVRVVFVLNVDDRLTAHARTPCEGD